MPPICITTLGFKQFLLPRNAFRLLPSELEVKKQERTQPYAPTNILNKYVSMAVLWQKRTRIIATHV